MKLIILKLIRFYQKYLSLDQGYLGRIFPAGRTCRFSPTCSQYTYEAVVKYGIIRGLFAGIKRILKCHPWHAGGWDPVR